MNITITLTDDQVKALKKIEIEKPEEIQKLITGTAKSVVKGRFKAYSVKAEEETGKHYDFVAKRSKMEMDRTTFINQYMKEVKDLLHALDK